MVDDSLKAILADIHRAGVVAASGQDLILRHSRFDGDGWTYGDGADALRWDIPRDGKLVVVGAGKAAASLAEGLEAVFGDRIDRGCVVVKYGHGGDLRHIRLLEAAHPIPDAASVAATRAMRECLEGLGPDDRVIVALTGGASSLLVAPRPPLTLADKARVSELLIASGASIEEINRVRRRLSEVKGGGLLDGMGGASSLTLAISDVPTRDLAMIGSGPTVRPDPGDEPPMAVIDRYGIADRLPAAVLALLEEEPETPALPAGRHEHLILADSGSALTGAAARAEALGYAVTVFDDAMTGNTHDAANRFAEALIAGRGPSVLLAVGETTLKVTGSGRGGRNQEFALVAAKALEGTADVALLSSGTDGTDGPTDAAGAFVDGDTIGRSLAAGLDPATTLANNDSYTLFGRLGELHMTGPTGTNVMDLVVGIRR
ncbi:DUF4147 domain-containing protein [Sphingomonas naphthae]|uniref:DUF4147 domain-containing protein n=1 Tax=Sphingomonas naphthae TaxID=1813468 RepID=A0ABY7TM94_9SPHN|nr:DUF4147 domain-containing protein [Sphingomonas naphthae]WCT74158.1 DUF4147 domain-containing protein [Sphingomonas naphthae]